MGKYFKEFCDSQRKIRITGHVPNVIDMCQADQDAAVVAMLKDSGQIAFANCHPSMSNDDNSDTQSYGMLNVIARVDKYDFENWHENASRIVACVNKFVGLTAEQIESMPVNVLQMTEFIDALNVSRDNYRELCVQLLEDLRYIKMTVTSPLDAYYIADEAVKKAENLLGEKK